MKQAQSEVSQCIKDAALYGIGIFKINGFEIEYIELRKIYNMPTMLDQLAMIIHKAIEEAPFKVVINKANGLFEVVDGKTVVFKSPLHDQSEDFMDSMNDKWIARKAVEGVRDLKISFHTVYDKAVWLGIMEGILGE